MYYEVSFRMSVVWIMALVFQKCLVHIAIIVYFVLEKVTIGSVLIASNLYIVTASCSKKIFLKLFVHFPIINSYWIPALKGIVSYLSQICFRYHRCLVDFINYRVFILVFWSCIPIGDMRSNGWFLFEILKKWSVLFIFQKMSFTLKNNYSLKI